MVFSRGDIVWVRVVFPTKWWPALVRSINGHRVAVSFFDDGEYSRYFFETEVCSFEENFDALVKTIKKSSRGEELLESSLRFLARRAAYSLRCPCHFRPLLPGGSIANRRRKIGESFQPDALLSFVLGLAVSPFVRDSDFVAAVTTASQLNVFRRYIVVEWKLRRPKTTGAGFLAQSSDVSKVGFVRADCWIQPNNGSRVHVNDANPQSLDDMQQTMNCLASHDNHSSEVELYQPGVEVNGKAKTCPDISTPPVSYLSNPTESRGFKRRYVQSVGSDFRFKFSKTVPFSQSRDNHNLSAKASIYERINALFCLKESSTEKISQAAQQSAHATQMEHTTCIDSNKVSVKNCGQDGIKAAFSSKESCIDSTGNKLLLPLGTLDTPSSNASTQLNRMDHSRHKRFDAAFSSKESPAKKSKEDKQSAHTVYGSCQKLYMKFPRDFNLPSKKDLIKKFRRFGQIDLVRTKVFERMGSAQVVFLHHSDAVTAYQYAKLKKSLFHGARVLFWLDRYEQTRNNTRFAAPFPKLKPCLKNPYSCLQEDKKPSRKVRFLMQS